MLQSTLSPENEPERSGALTTAQLPHSYKVTAPSIEEIRVLIASTSREDWKVWVAPFNHDETLYRSLSATFATHGFGVELLVQTDPGTLENILGTGTLLIFHPEDTDKEEAIEIKDDATAQDLFNLATGKIRQRDSVTSNDPVPSVVRPVVDELIHSNEPVTASRLTKNIPSLAPLGEAEIQALWTDLFLKYLAAREEQNFPKQGELLGAISVLVDVLTSGMFTQEDLVPIAAAFNKETGSITDMDLFAEIISLPASAWSVEAEIDIDRNLVFRRLKAMESDSDGDTGIGFEFHAKYDLRTMRYIPDTASLDVFDIGDAYKGLRDSSTTLAGKPVETLFRIVECNVRYHFPTQSKAEAGEL